MTRPGPRWAALVFPLLAVLLSWEAFRPGYVLLPTALQTFPPWDELGPPPGPSNPLMADALLLTLPGRAYNHEMLRQGRLPFWNPRIFCGYPHLAMIQNNALYPFSAPFDLFSPLTSIAAAAILHLALAGALMDLFLRRTGLGRPAALVGGVAFELNGMFLIRMSAPSYVYSGVWLPLLLLGARAVVDGSRERWLLPLGVALTVLGGHPQIAALAIALAAAYMVWEAALSGGRWRGAVPAFILLAIGGLGLASFALIPFLELVAHSARDAMPLAVYRRAATPAAALLQALVPDVFGHPVRGTYWFDRLAPLLDGTPREARPWALNYSGQDVFTGWAPLVLAGVAVARGRARREIAFFVLAVLASLAVFLGTPLLDLGWALLPAFRYSRPDRILFLYMAAMAVLAAHGADAATSAAKGPVPRDGAARLGRPTRHAITVLAALIVWAALKPVLRLRGLASWTRWASEAAAQWRADGAHLVPQSAAAIVVIVAAVVLARSRRSGPAWTTAWIALVALPSLWFGWRFNPAQPDPHLGATAAERQLMEGARGMRVARLLTRSGAFLPPNLGQLVGLDDVQGSSAAGVESYLRLVQAADPAAVSLDKYFLAFRDPRVAQTPLLRLLGVGQLATDAALGWPPTGVARGEITLRRNPEPVPRFHVVAGVEGYDDVTRARARLLSADFDPARMALVEKGEVALPALPPEASDAIAGTTVNVARFDAHDVVLDVTTTGAGLLVSSETAYPGWESEVDGRAVPTLLVNTAFRGVAVPAGAHRVRMRYVPRSFLAGLALSVATAVVMGWRLAREMRPASS